MTRDELKEYISVHLEGKLTPLDSGKYDPLFELQENDLLTVAQVLRDDANLKFDFLSCITGIDTGERFEIVYSITSPEKNLRLDLKVVLSREKPEVESVRDIWPAANWYEREIWELYGFDIKNHGNLTRFLLADDWDQGHPMLKDWDAPDFVRFPELER